jgi:hypothetical protein
MRRSKAKRGAVEDRLREILRTHNLAPSGYTIATHDPMQMTQVVVLAGLRYVVREQLTREEYQRRIAKNARRRAEQAREFGLGSVPGRLSITLDGAQATDVQESNAGAPAGVKYFYALERLN